LEIFLAGTDELGTDELVPDEDCEKFFMTWNPGGYLRRVA
jgi:hypothetical protein